VNERADNIANVGQKYYLDMISRGEEYVKVYACGQYGVALDGKSVYKNYNDDLHSVKTIEFERHVPLEIYVDYGFYPACLVCQYIDGQFRAIKEFVGMDMTVSELFTASVLPYLKIHCKGMQIDAITGDPADTDRGSDQLKALGLYVDQAVTNQLDVRISSVYNMLNKLHNKKPRVLISRDGCPKLREGFLGEYFYKRLKVIGEDRHQEQPYKSHPYSDLQDCFQYFVISREAVTYTLSDEDRQKAYEAERVQKNYRETTRNEITGY
jgi:hypothetical protein